MVSLTAAKTRRMLVVSVACVRLANCQQQEKVKWTSDLLRVEIEIRSVDLVESPQQVFRSSVHVVAARVVWKIIAERGSCELDLEQIHLVKEQDDAGPHKPS